MTPFIAVIRHCTVIILLMGAVKGAEIPPPLTTIAEVHALGLKQAALNHTVLLRGIVTYCDPHTGRAYMQDNSGAISFQSDSSDQPETLKLIPGDRVEILGVTTSRGQGWSPMVVGLPPTVDAPPTPATIRRLGHGPLPEPIEVSSEKLQSGAVQNQYVSLRGTIRTVRSEAFKGGTQLSILISGPRGRDGWKVPASLITPIAPDVGLWENHVGEIRGVATGSGRDPEGSSVPQLLIPTVDQIIPQHDVIRRAFDQTPRPLSDIFHHQPLSAGGDSPYIHVLGSVTLGRPGEGLYLGEGNRGLWVQTPQGTTIRTGDQLDVIGLPGRDSSGAYLKDAIFRVTGHKTLPVPPLLEPVRAIEDENYIAARVSLEGELVDDIQEAGFRWVLLDNDGLRIHARIFGSPLETDTTTWEDGSWLRVTGVCDPPQPLEVGGSPLFLTILVGSQTDIQVVRAAPWLTPRRLGLLVAALSFAIALGVLWLGLLHRQVARQTRFIREQTKQRTLVDERQRMARELHDTLEQQLVGIQVRIDSANHWLPNAPIEVRAALLEARGMLDHSRAEARRSIFELRSPALDELSLPGAAQSSATEFAESGSSKIEVVTRGRNTACHAPSSSTSYASSKSRSPMLSNTRRRRKS